MKTKRKLKVKVLEEEVQPPKKPRVMFDPDAFREEVVEHVAKVFQAEFMTANSHLKDFVDRALASKGAPCPTSLKPDPTGL